MLTHNIFAALEIARHPDQGGYKKVLCVCSAGLLRSATAAVVLSQPPFNFNTRAAGLGESALIQVNDVLLHWADEIVCMTQEYEGILLGLTDKPILCLYIPDDYQYRDPYLKGLISDRYKFAAANQFTNEPPARETMTAFVKETNNGS
jgi:predicted protein tyrosine phosphatase